MLVRTAFCYLQRRTLVNVKLKWFKDPFLDNVVTGGRDHKATCVLISLIASDPNGCLPVYKLSRCRGQLGLPDGLKISTFLRRYPNIFEELFFYDSGGTKVPCFRLSDEALKVHQDELFALSEFEVDILNRLKRLLMMCKNRVLPLHTIDQLKWDLCLPYDYRNSLLKRNQDWFKTVQLNDGRNGLKLMKWDDNLTISHLEMNSNVLKTDSDKVLAFPIGFTRGFGLKRKCIKWLEEWQKLPYTSPYSNYSHLDPRTDVSEKRVVGVFHELLNLTIQKTTERRNVSNLRKPLGLPQKFTKAFERHPGIFYISRKGDIQTVVLREAYDRDQLIENHPLVEIRKKIGGMMKEGFLERSRGLYKIDKPEEWLDQEWSTRYCDDERSKLKLESGEESENYCFSEYDSDETS